MTRPKAELILCVGCGTPDSGFSICLKAVSIGLSRQSITSDRDFFGRNARPIRPLGVFLSASSPPAQMIMLRIHPVYCDTARKVKRFSAHILSPRLVPISANEKELDVRRGLCYVGGTFQKCRTSLDRKQFRGASPDICDQSSCHYITTPPPLSIVFDFFMVSTILLPGG